MRCTERVKFCDAIESLSVSALIARNEIAVGGVRCDAASLETLETLGKLLCWVVKSGGNIVGHCAMVFDNGTATQLAFFVEENHRAGCIARRALSEIDRDLIDLGATRILRQVLAPHDGPAYLHGIGYEELETSYVLNVGG